MVETKNELDNRLELELNKLDRLEKTIMNTLDIGKDLSKYFLALLNYKEIELEKICFGILREGYDQTDIMVAVLYILIKGSLEDESNKNLNERNNALYLKRLLCEYRCLFNGSEHKLLEFFNRISFKSNPYSIDLDNISVIGEKDRDKGIQILVSAIFSKLAESKLVLELSQPKVEERLSNIVTKEELKKINGAYETQDVSLIISEMNVLSGIEINEKKYLKSLNAPETNIEFKVQEVDRYKSIIGPIFVAINHYYLGKIPIESVLTQISGFFTKQGAHITLHEHVKINKILQKGKESKFNNLYKDIRDWFIYTILKPSYVLDRSSILNIIDINTCFETGKLKANLYDFFDKEDAINIEKKVSSYKRHGSNEDKIYLENIFNDHKRRINLLETSELEEDKFIVVETDNKFNKPVTIRMLFQHLRNYYSSKMDLSDEDIFSSFVMFITMGMDEFIDNETLVQFKKVLLNKGFYENFFVAEEKLNLLVKKKYFGLSMEKTKEKTAINRAQTLKALALTFFVSLAGKDVPIGDRRYYLDEVYSIYKKYDDVSERDIYGYLKIEDLEVCDDSQFRSYIIFLEESFRKMLGYIDLFDIGFSKLKIAFERSDIIEKLVFHKVAYETYMKKIVFENEKDNKIKNIEDLFSFTVKNLSDEDYDIIFRLAQVLDSYNLYVSRILTVKQILSPDDDINNLLFHRYGFDSKEERERQEHYLFGELEAEITYKYAIFNKIIYCFVYSLDERVLILELVQTFILKSMDYICEDKVIPEENIKELFDNLFFAYNKVKEFYSEKYNDSFDQFIDKFISILYKHLVEKSSQTDKINNKYTMITNQIKNYISLIDDTALDICDLSQLYDPFDLSCLSFIKNVFRIDLLQSEDKIKDFFDSIYGFAVEKGKRSILIKDLIKENKVFLDAFANLIFHKEGIKKLFVENKMILEENVKDGYLDTINKFLGEVYEYNDKEICYMGASLFLMSFDEFLTQYKEETGDILFNGNFDIENKVRKSIRSYNMINQFSEKKEYKPGSKPNDEMLRMIYNKNFFYSLEARYQDILLNILCDSDYRTTCNAMTLINDILVEEQDIKYIKYFFSKFVPKLFVIYKTSQDLHLYLSYFLAFIDKRISQFFSRELMGFINSEKCLPYIFIDNIKEKRWEFNEGWSAEDKVLFTLLPYLKSIESKLNQNILLRRSEQIFDYIMSDNIELGEVGAEIKELEERIRYGKRRVLASGNMYKFRLKELKDNRLTEVFHTAYVSRGVIDLTPELMEERISGDYKQVSGKKSKSIYFVGAKKDEKGQYGNIVIQVVFERDGRYKITPCIREGNKFNRMKGCDYIKEGEVGEAERIIMENIYYLSLKVLERYYLSRTAEEIEAIKEERIYKKEASQRREEEEIREVKVEEEETKEELLKKMTVIRQVKAKEEFYAPVGEDIEQEERAGEEKRRILAKKVKCLKKLFKGKVFDRELAAKSILYVKEDLPKEYGDKLGISYTQMRTINEYPKGYIEIDPEHDRMALTQLEKIYKLQRYDDGILEYIYVQTVSPHITRLPYIFYSRRLGEGKSMYVSTQKRPTEESKEKYESFIEEYPEEELPLFNKEIRSNLVVKSYLPKRLEIEESVFEGVDMNNVKEVKSGFMRLRERVRLQGEEVDKVSQYKMIDEVMKNLRLIEEMSSDRYEESLNKRKEELIRERARVFKSEELGAEDGISDIREKVMSKLTELIEARNLRRARIKKKDMEEGNEILFEVIEKIEKDKRLEEVDIIVLEDIFKEAVIEDNVRDYKVDIERQSIIRAKLESIGKLSKVSDIFSVESREYMLTRLYNEYERRESIMERGERLIEDEIPSYERFLSELINIEQIDIKISETEDMGIRRELIEARNRRVKEMKYMEVGDSEGLARIDNKLKEIEYMLKTVKKQREERVFDIRKRQIYYVLPDFPTYITFNRGNIIPVKKFLSE